MPEQAPIEQLGYLQGKWYGITKNDNNKRTLEVVRSPPSEHDGQVSRLFIWQKKLALENIQYCADDVDKEEAIAAELDRIFPWIGEKKSSRDRKFLVATIDRYLAGVFGKEGNGGKAQHGKMLAYEEDGWKYPAPDLALCEEFARVIGGGDCSSGGSKKIKKMGEEKEGEEKAANDETTNYRGQIQELEDHAVVYQARIAELQSQAMVMEARIAEVKASKVKYKNKYKALKAEVEDRDNGEEENDDKQEGDDGEEDEDEEAHDDEDEDNDETEEDSPDRSTTNIQFTFHRPRVQLPTTPTKQAKKKRMIKDTPTATSGDDLADFLARFNLRSPPVLNVDDDDDVKEGSRKDSRKKTKSEK